jgi:hypothetical protein
MFSGEIASRSFKTIARRRIQVSQDAGIVDHHQLSADDFRYIGRESLRNGAVAKDRLREFSLESPDHRRNVS